MDTPSLRLFHAPRCPFSMRARLLLREKGLDYESHEVPSPVLDPVAPSLVPRTRAPVLRHGECALSDTEVMAEYLEVRYPEPPLYPREPAGQAQAHLLIRWFDRRVVEDLARLSGPAAGLLAGTAGDPRLRVRAALHTIGGLVAPAAFVLGPFGIVDLFFAPFLVDLNEPIVWPGEIPEGVAAWIERLRERPSIAEELRRGDPPIGWRAVGG